MRVLVTGANGLVGKALCANLVQSGIPFRAAVRSPISVLTGLDNFVTGAIDGSTDWQGALTDVTVVIHLAARVHVLNDTAENPLEEYRRINVQGTLNLAENAVTAGISRFVYLSTAKVNGESTHKGQAFSESDEPNPLDPYAVSKHEAEQGLRKIADQTGMDVVIIRPPLVYGPGVKANFAALLRAVQKGWPLPLGVIHNQRSLVALDNLVDFIMTCAIHPKAANQTFMVSDGHDISTTELVHGLAHAAGVLTHLLPVPIWILQWVGRFLGKGDTVGRLCNNLQINSAKARDLLGWVPPVSVHEGLQRAVDGVVNP